MIAKGTTHNNGAKLARYITTGKAGERAELAELRGFASPDIVEAFRSVHVMAEGTKCERPFMHVQVRLPDDETLTREQWLHVADRIEAKLGLSGQPRAIAFHNNARTGHDHMHVAWSRIDEDTLTARPVPFFKRRLKEVSRELEQELGLTLVRNERDSAIGFAPTRAEDEQARRLGLDVHKVLEFIRGSYDRADNGISFQAALADEGFTLAQGDRRGFVVIDPAGGIHALGKRILDVSAAAIRDHLADLAREDLPTVAQARAIGHELAELQKQAAAERQYAERDPVREDMDWHDAVARAAIEKEKEQERERRSVEPKARDTRTQATPPAPELGRTAGEIRLARRLTYSPQGFANALEDRGLILARVTAADLEKLAAQDQQRAEAQPQTSANTQPLPSRPQPWMAQRGGADRLTPEHQETARRSYEAWPHKSRYSFENYVAYVQKQWEQNPGKGQQQGQRFRAGELAVVNQRGDVYGLTQRNTGLGRNERQAYLSGIDRGPLLSVTDAQAVMNDLQQHRQNEWLHGLPLPKGVGAEICDAYQRSDSGRAFAAALEDRNLHLSRVSKEDAAYSHRLAAFAEEIARFALELKEGELAVVNRFGGVYRLTPRNTRVDDATRAAFLADIDRDALLTVADTRAAMQEARDHGRAETDWRKREQHWPIYPPQPEPGKTRFARRFQMPETHPRHHLEDAAREATAPEPVPQMPDNLRGVAAVIWQAYNIHTRERVWERDWLGQAYGPASELIEQKVETLSLKGGRDPWRFAAALEEKGLALARVTRDEAEKSQNDADHSKGMLDKHWPEAERSPKDAARSKHLLNEHWPTTREGEIVAVTAGGQVYQLNRRTTGHDPEQVQRFLQKVEWKGLYGIEATKEMLKGRAETRAVERQGTRDEIAAARLKRATTMNRTAPQRSKGKGTTKAPARVFGKAGKLGLGVVTNALESLFAPPQTPERKLEGEIASQSREADAQHTTDFSQHMADLAQQRQNHQEQHAARHRHREPERER